MGHNRRVTVVALIVLLATLVGACGGGGDDDSATPTPTTARSGRSSTTEARAARTGAHVGLVYDLGGPGDHAFNDAAEAGLDRAEKALDVKVEHLVPVTGSDRAALVEQLAMNGSELVLGVSFLFEDAIRAAATKHPDTTFAAVDGVVDLPNVDSLTFAENEGSYLMGAAAALTSKTGKIGFIGGAATDAVRAMQAGYAAGARAIKADIEIDVQYLSTPPDLSGFTSPARGRQVALAEYDGGADVVYHAARASGGGVFAAAKEHSASGGHVWAIGGASDQYVTIGDPTVQPFILTSMLKKLDTAVYDVIERFAAGDAIGGGRTVYGLAEGAVDYARSGGFVDAIASKLDELKQQIIDGAIEVPDTP